MTSLVGQVECFIPSRGKDLSGVTRASECLQVTRDGYTCLAKRVSLWYVCLSSMPGLIIELFWVKNETVSPNKKDLLNAS